MAHYIAGKSVVITGAGSGFGRLTAEKLAAEGARLTCIDVNAEAAEAIAAAIRAAGVRPRRLSPMSLPSRTCVPLPPPRSLPTARST
ncbi:SDR family NAD(P)-dependent oxidoreductase [Novosphingobium sp. G106]|nr:SDR family NAD(P)-dependent oxidoreductase [Novosphingobium sp. G106]